MEPFVVWRAGLAPVRLADPLMWESGGRSGCLSLGIPAVPPLWSLLKSGRIADSAERNWTTIDDGIPPLLIPSSISVQGYIGTRLSQLAGPQIMPSAPLSI